MRRVGLVLLGVLLAWAPVMGQTPAEKKATVVYVQGLQTTDGGFLPTRSAGKPPAPSLRATAAALRALKYFDGVLRDRESCATFVHACFDKAGGGFADFPGGKPDVITTAVGLMAVVELKMPVGEYVDPAVRYLGTNARTFEEVRMAAAGLEAVGKRVPQTDAWLKQIAALRNPDGTYGRDDGKARATGGAVAAWLRLGGKIEHPETVVAALKQGQRPDGGFGKEGATGSDLETSYRVLRSLVMLKEKPASGDRLRAFVARCRNADGGYGVAPGQPSTTSGTYFAAIILHWLGPK